MGQHRRVEASERLRAGTEGGVEDVERETANLA